MFEWTSERKAQLTQLASEDLSASQIAREFGVSRNAVIGKLTRMGMRTGHAVYHPVGKEKREKSERRFRPREREPKKLDKKLETLPATEPVELAAELPPDQSPHAIPFMQAADNQCRWSLDDEPSADMLVCGATKIKGLAYCPRHARIAHSGRD